MKKEQSLIVKDACAWPSLFHLDNKRIGAVIFNRPSHGLEEGSLELWTFDRSGEFWHHLSTPAPCPEGQNRMHSCCGCDQLGFIHVLSTGFSIKDGKFLALESLWHSLSKDGGKTWEVHKDIDIEGIATKVVTYGNIITDIRGDLFATVYHSWGKGEPSLSWVIRSKDGGASWKTHGQIGDGDTNEAYLINCGQYLLCGVRTHKDHHTRLYRSDNTGKTWTDEGLLTLPMQHPGHLVRIGSEGLLFTYGIRNKGLMGIGARVSMDLGSNWLPPVVLHQFPEKTSDCGYPSSVMLDQHTLLTGFYTDCSQQYQGYQFGSLKWELQEILAPKHLRSISDGGPMRI